MRTLMSLSLVVLVSSPAWAQEVPADYAQVLQSLGRQGDYKDAVPVVAGDVAMLAGEITPVLKALRVNGIDVVAIHHHMTETAPEVYFLHYWGKGPAQKLATGVKAAIDHLGPGRAARR